MPARSPSLSRAVTAALKDAQFLTRDGATVALVRRYATLIEDAEAVAQELADAQCDDESTAATVARLRAKVDAQTVASDLGPKLLAALAALGMTPAARASVTKGGTPGATTPQGDALSRLRAERAAGR